VNFKTIMMAALVVSSPVVASATWVIINSSQESKFYIDTSSVSENGGVVKAWLKKIVSTPAQDKIRTIIQRWEINCNSHTWRVTSEALYDTNGNLLGSISESTLKFEDIVPDTMVQMTEGHVCPKK